MACRSHEKAASAKSEIEAAGGIKGTLSTVQLDVTDQKSIEQAAAQVQQQFGRLDVLVNNAGLGSLGADTRTRFQRCLETNVTGPATVAEAFRPLLFKAQNPYSIYVGSGARTLVRNGLERPPSHANIQNGDAYQASNSHFPSPSTALTYSKKFIR